MVRVVIAEHGGNNWLVGGVELVDEVLMGTLPPDTVVEFTKCSNQAEFAALTEALAGPEGQSPWIINPLIIRRLRGQGQVEEGVVKRIIEFSSWSAMLDETALAMVAQAALWLQENQAGRLVLRQMLSADAAMADMQRLRSRLVAGALGRAGAEAGRLREEMRAGMAEPDGDPGSENRLEVVCEEG